MPGAWNDKRERQYEHIKESDEEEWARRPPSLPEQAVPDDAGVRDQHAVQRVRPRAGSTE